MKQFRAISVLLTLLIVLLAFQSVQAAKLNKGDQSPLNRASIMKAKSLAYAVPMEPKNRPSAPSADRIPLGTDSYVSNSLSPGVTIGDTWYEYQHNCSMGRMIETGPHSGHTGPTIVHMGWMHLPDSSDYNVAGRTYMYNAYKSSNHTFAGAYRLHDYEDEYSGYVNVDVTPDNRALVGGHCDQKGPVPYQTQIHFDACPACELFDTYVRIPDSTAVYGQEIGNEAIWPKFFFQFGTDTVLHVAAQVSTDNRTKLQALMYFRRVGYEGSPDNEWDFPPYVVDSVPVIAQDITGERMGDRVCMAWFANLPYQEPNCDTCSGESPYPEEWVFFSMDNDIYVQVSNDQGLHWDPRSNITQVPIGEAAYKAYCDCSILFDQSGNLHLVWHGCPWPADPCAEEGGMCWEDDFDVQKARLFHWSENVPYIRTICDHTYWSIDADSCWTPPFALRVAKPTLSECDGKLYVIWTQFNDIPNGVIDDCADWGFNSDDPTGAINGDIWVSVSEDGGMTWDAQRNLTNTYTPHCDPVDGDDCENEYWASMSRWGRQVQPLEEWDLAEVIDPSAGSSPTDYYLDIQYVQDLSSGSIVHDYGVWTNNPVKWFRMPCVEPVPNPVFIAEWYSLGEPNNYVAPGTQFDVPLFFENAGNVELTYTITVVEDNGPTGWLSTSDFSGAVPSGLGNIEYGTVHLNTGGIVTQTGNYFARLHIEGNDPVNLPTDIEIEMIVTDNPPPDVVRDTVNTNCLSLIAGSDGNMGYQAVLERGGANMDYYPADCDTVNGKVYLYDGSPLIGRIIGTDTVFNWSIWGANYLSDDGFRYQDGAIPTKFCNSINAEVFESGTFTTQDSTVAFEKIWVAPLDDCPFILQYMRVWSFDGAAHSGLMIGEGIDWDVPWDFLSEEVDPNQDRLAINTGGIDVTRNLLYCQGYENPSDTGYPYNCQYNDTRFAGNAFIQSYLNGASRAPMPYGGFVGENDSLQALNGFIPGLLWEEMIQSGLKGIDSTEDLHTVMTFENALDLGASDVYEVVTVIATVHQGTLADLQAAVDAAELWYNNNGGLSIFDDLDDDGQIDVCLGCCNLMGDFNGDEQVDALDIVAFVEWLWKGGPGPDCPEEVDVNCDCQLDALDLVYMVEWFWKSGPEPCPCHECEEI